MADEGLNGSTFEVPVASRSTPLLGPSCGYEKDFSGSEGEASDDNLSESSKMKKNKSKSGSKSPSPRHDYGKSNEEEPESLIAKVKIVDDNGCNKSARDLTGDDRPPSLDPKRRTRIPDKLNQGLNLWAFLKNCIGKELTKIPMPVNFNEPLSMLQRITEDFEYAHLLHKAAQIEDSCDQLVLIAGFAVSSYSTTSRRTNKPFNPLLGETFECDRASDLGWKCISEQISHHPPILALHCQGEAWKFYSELGLNSKFRGKYLRIDPVGTNHVDFPKQGYHYTWQKVSITIHNIIVGKLWVENHGDMLIQNHTTGDKCLLRFFPHSYFSREPPRKVSGSVINQNGDVKWALQGTWDGEMKAYRVNNQKLSASKKISCEVAKPITIWRRIVPPAKYEKMYNMTAFAVQLNEPEEGVAPTDSRLRPDQRLMEQGRWDEANEVKGLLEEKQRLTRSKLEQEASQDPSKRHSPAWFRTESDPITKSPVHIFTNEYWTCKAKQDWSRCSDIFSYQKSD